MNRGPLDFWHDYKNSITFLDNRERRYCRHVDFVVPMRHPGGAI